MRAAPDVLLIGEIRDRETMESAIMLAGTGHLVLATLHANNAAETLDRIINMFPRDQHTQIFLDLSQYLRADHRAASDSGQEQAPRRRGRIADQHAARAGADQEGRRDRRQGSAAHQQRERHAAFRYGAVRALSRRAASRWKMRWPTPTRARTSKRRSTSDSRARSTTRQS